MDKKIALLRGINVGGKRKVLMKDLKLMFENLGFTNISTYIQSGNIFFNTSDSNNISLSKTIENKINNEFGFNVPVIVLNNKEIETAINQNVFYNSENKIEQLHLTFLKETPQKIDLSNLNIGSDQFKIIDKNIFICCEGKYHQSKLTNAFFEKKLQTPTTTRNWKTVLKLYELSKNDEF